MSKNGLHLQERLDATGGSMSTGEKAHTTRVWRDDELDFVSGGFKVEIGGLPCDRLAVNLENCMISG